MRFLCTFLFQILVSEASVVRAVAGITRRASSCQQMAAIKTVMENVLTSRPSPSDNSAKTGQSQGFRQSHRNFLMCKELRNAFLAGSGDVAVQYRVSMGVFVRCIT